MNNKNNAQNIVKGLLITGVVYFHALLFFVPNPDDILAQFNIMFVLFPCLMTVFFFYSGYNYTSGKRRPIESIKRRIIQLLIPLAISFVVSILLIMAIRLPTGESMEAIGNSILLVLMSPPLAFMIGFPSSGVFNFDLYLALGILWFLYTLFISSVFFYLIVDYAIKKLSRLISIIALLLIASFLLGQFVGVYLPYVVNSYPLVIAVMLAGAYLKQHNFLDPKIESKKDVFIVITNSLVAELIIVGTCLAMYFMFGSTMVGALAGGQFNAVLKGFDVFISFMFAILGTYVIHQLARLLAHIKVVGAALSYYGSKTSYVYLTHAICLSFVHYVVFGGNNLVGEAQPLIYVAFTIVVLVIIFLLIDYIAKKIKEKKTPKENIA